MSVAVEDRPQVLGNGHGGMPARRAVIRWAWRLFRREWRQQSVVLALLLVAVAATTVGLGIGANATQEGSVLGTADFLATLSSTGPQLDADIATLRSSFGPIDVIEHAKAIPMPGSTSGVDVRAQDPNGAYGSSMLRLDKGRWPQGAGEIAVTDGVAKIFKLKIGDTWSPSGPQWTVVGLVENPQNLSEPFVLVAPGQVTAVDHVDVLIKASMAEFSSKPRPDGMSVQLRSNEANSASTVVLMLATIGLVFVGLLAVAGFTVMAQRRLRALGMLGAIGASHRHIRLVLLANGVVIGSVGALTGAIVGVSGWIALSPRLEPLVNHRMDRFHLPWAPVVIAVLLATATAVVAAWWPARAAARVPVVAALSARPVPPRPTHRFAAVGAVLLGLGAASLYVAQQTKPVFIIAGVLGTAIALLLLAPVGIAAIGRLADRAPLAPRLAMRDLSRYRARSGAALAAIGLAVGIAVAIAVSGAVASAKMASPSGGNLPADQVIVWLSREAMGGPVPVLSAAQLEAAQKQADTIATDLHATSAVPLTGATNPDLPQERNGRLAVFLGIPHAVGDGIQYMGSESVPVFVATPELLTHYGIDPASINAGTDLVTSLASTAGYDLAASGSRDWQPVLQHVSLPSYSSLPRALITTHGMTLSRMQLTTMPVGWLIDAPNPLTAAQIDKAQQTASGAGLYVESRRTGADQTQLANGFTTAGIIVALGVLAMTVGLIRSETARDLRTLTATGARRNTRRALTAATAGALALAGAIIGTACAYVGLLAWYHREAHWLAHPPVANLAAILLGLPIVAYAAGWLMSGREPATISRQQVE